MVYVLRFKFHSKSRTSVQCTKHSFEKKSAVQLVMLEQILNPRANIDTIALMSRQSTRLHRRNAIGDLELMIRLSKSFLGSYHDYGFINIYHRLYNQ